MNLPVSLCSQVGARNGVAVPICARDRKKETAVPLPIHRLGLTPTIPPSAALKPLELCDSIDAKPVQSAVITPQQRGKREPIPFLYASYLRSRAVRPVREVAQKGGRWSPKRIETTVGGVYPFGNRSRRPQTAKLPSPETAYCFATRVHRRTDAVEWAAAHGRRIANATRVHQRMGAEKKAAAGKNGAGCRHRAFFVAKLKPCCS